MLSIVIFFIVGHIQGLKLAEVWQTCLLLHMSGFLKVCPSGTNRLRRLTGND